MWPLGPNPIWGKEALCAHKNLQSLSRWVSLLENERLISYVIKMKFIQLVRRKFKSDTRHVTHFSRAVVHFLTR